MTIFLIGSENIDSEDKYLKSKIPLYFQSETEMKHCKMYDFSLEVFFCL